MPTFSTEQWLLYDHDVPRRKIIHRPGLTIYVPDDDQDQEPKFNEEEKEIDEEEEGDDDQDQEPKFNEEEKEIDEEEEGEEEEDEVDTYSCDEFRMYEFKVRRCMRGRSHDWTDCPFAHPGEKARRRDPRRYHYSSAICPHFRRSGACPRGDFCEFAHGVFECWLHPTRYRTMPCKDGRRCRRKVCFFAHSPSQLRRLPSPGSPCTPSCCAPISCRFSPSGGAFQLSSHTAPVNNKNTGSSRGSCKGLFPSEAMGYDSVPELVSSLEAMELSGDTVAASSAIDGNGQHSFSSFDPIEERDSAEQQSSSDSGGPDLEWVNELLT